MHDWLAFSEVFADLWPLSGGQPQELLMTMVSYVVSRCTWKWVSVDQLLVNVDQVSSLLQDYATLEAVGQGYILPGRESWDDSQNA